MENPLLSSKKIPMGEGLLEKKGTGCLMNIDINMLLYIYIHIKLRSNLRKLRFSYFLWLEAGKATICTPIQVHCVTFCPLMQARCTLFFYLKYLAISELLQWSRLLSALNIITACILYRKQRSVVCILTNLHERRKMHMRLAFFFWNHICLLYIYVYINMNVFICM